MEMTDGNSLSQHLVSAAETAKFVHTPNPVW